MPIDHRRYTSPADVRMRLDGTVIRYGGIPVFAEARPDMNVRVREVLSEKVYTVDSSDENLDISSPPLGYCNLEATDNLWYITRVPFRQQKQGLHLHSMSYKRPGDIETRRISGWPDTEGLHNMIVGKYPTLSQSIDYVRRNGNSGSGRAFDRRFALGYCGQKSLFTLQTRGDVIGLYNANKEIALVKTEYKDEIAQSILKKFMAVRTIETHDEV